MICNHRDVRAVGGAEMRILAVVCLASLAAAGSAAAESTSIVCSNGNINRVYFDIDFDNSILTMQTSPAIGPWDGADFPATIDDSVIKADLSSVNVIGEKPALVINRNTGIADLTRGSIRNSYSCRKGEFDLVQPILRERDGIINFQCVAHNKYGDGEVDIGSPKGLESYKLTVDGQINFTIDRAKASVLAVASDGRNHYPSSGKITGQNRCNVLFDAKFNARELKMDANLCEGVMYLTELRGEPKIAVVGSQCISTDDDLRAQRKF
jgi:hypothetical protein